MKHWLLSLLILPLLGVLMLSSPARSNHVHGEELLKLRQEPTASIIEVTPRYEQSRLFLSPVYEADYSFQLLGLNWQEVLPENTAAAIEIRFQNQSEEWTDWQPLQADEDHPDQDEALWTYVLTPGSMAFQYRVHLSTLDSSVTPKLSDISFDYVDGGESSTWTKLKKMVFDKDKSVISRDHWGADEDYRLAREHEIITASSSDDNDDGDWEETDPDLEIVDAVYIDEEGNKLWWPQEYPKEVKKIILHHTATTDDLDDPEDAIRAIYYYHAMTRGWGDIGYNFVVAPDGTVYEGRAGGNGVVAGHASGYNTGTVGIALLGNYEENQIPSEMMQALTGLVYQKAESHDIDPTGAAKYRGESFSNIIGHRDVDATTCPGYYTYDFLTDIRRLVAEALEAEQTDNADGTDLSFKEIGDRELVALKPHEKTTLALRIQNTGTETWNEDTYLIVNADEEADTVITIPKDSKKRSASMNESSVRPEGTATFSFTVTATEEGGLATFDATLMFNGEEKSSHYLNLAFYVEVGEEDSKDEDSEQDTGDDDNVVVGHYDELDFNPGESKYVWVQVKNTSEETWSTSGDIPFSLVFTEPKGLSTGEPHTAFRNLNPGVTSKVYFELTAPEEEGEYILSIRPRLGSSNLTTEAYEITITVREQDEFEEENFEDPIRIKLTPDNGIGAPIVSSKSVFAFYDDDELVEVFPENSRVRITPDEDAFAVTAGSEKWTVQGVLRFVPEQNGIMKILTMDQVPAWDTSLNDNSFRGILEIRNVDDENGNIETVLINELPLESYLKGIAEISNDDPTEKVKTILVLARSYAIYYMIQAEKFPGMPYHLEDDPNTSQKYLGYGFESRSFNVAQAAEDTEGQVVTYQGNVVKTPYFNQSDGKATKSAKAVWGWTDTPWLVSVPDPYCDSNAFSGHGVGLSGCGATALAGKGWSFEEIIKYYYTGVELSTL